MTWKVELAGDSAELSTLLKSLSDSNEMKISNDGERYFLTSANFRDSDEAKTIKQKAERIIVILNGACRLLLDSRDSIKISVVERINSDGQPEKHVFPEPATIHFRTISPSLQKRYADGTVEEFHPADPMKEWGPLALNDEKVETVLTIVSNAPLDWINLYKIDEIISQDVGGTDNIVTNGWASKPSLKLFRNTANKPGAIGLEARHGVDKGLPPPKPMTLPEARSLIDSIIHAWLRYKSESSN